MIKEFKEFAFKGNVIDMAVGVVMGGAFGKIVTSLVNDVITPFIGLLVGGSKVSEMKVVLSTTVNENGETIQNALMYGQFLQTIIDFVIIAACIFLFIKLTNKYKRKVEEAPAGPTTEQLLIEIRDELKKK